MPKRKDNSTLPFSLALEEAAKRLVQAMKERTKAQALLGSLNAEIPSLEQTIRALRQQLNPTKFGESERPFTAPTPLNSPPALEMARNSPSSPPPNIPPEIAKYVIPTDMSPFGSIPIDAVQPEITQEEIVADTSASNK